MNIPELQDKLQKAKEYCEANGNRAYNISYAFQSEQKIDLANCLYSASLELDEQRENLLRAHLLIEEALNILGQAEMIVETATDTSEAIVSRLNQVIQSAK
jgi:hypothetical protein